MKEDVILGAICRKCGKPKVCCKCRVKNKNSSSKLHSIRKDLERAASAVFSAGIKCDELGMKRTKKEIGVVWADLVKAGKIIWTHIESNGEKE